MTNSTPAGPGPVPVANGRDLGIDVDVAAPPARVWEVMIEVERWPDWTASVSSIKRLESGPFGVGSTVLIRQPGFPPARWRVTALEPGRAFTWVSGLPGLRVTAHHGVEAAPGGSHVRLELHYAGIFGGFVARKTRDLTEKYLVLEASGLKRRSEAGRGPEPGSPA